MSPNHQTKASLSSNLCPEPVDSGLSMKFPHYPERWVLVSSAVRIILLCKKTTFLHGKKRVIWLKEARI